MSDAEALIEERRGYVIRGLKSRIAAVDAELKRLGVAVSDDDLETTDATPRKARKSATKKRS